MQQSERNSLSACAAGALDSVRRSLLRSPSALAAFAVAAGLGAHADAWAQQYSSVGRSIGYEMGRAVGGTGPQGRIASLVLQSVGAAAGSQLDAPPSRSTSAEQRRIESLQQQAREQAARDAAYVSTRRQLDPGYVEPRGEAGGRPVAFSAPVSAEQRRIQQLEKEARDQAIRDHAYAAERARLDPSYRALAQQAARANAYSNGVQEINGSMDKDRSRYPMEGP